MIRKNGNTWVLYSKDGKKILFTSDKKSEVEKREREINYFKHRRK